MALDLISMKWLAVISMVINIGFIGGDELEIENVAKPLLYPPAKKSSGVNVTSELIVDHVLNIFIDNIPGIIANTHKVIADKHRLGTRSEECIECASLFARAIDACKTGETIDLTRINQLKDEYYQTCPAWMMKFDKPEMDPPSTSINEILYRKARNAWIDQDNFQDILRPLHGVELPPSQLAIEIDDTGQTLEGGEAEEQNKYCCERLCYCFIVIVILIIACVCVIKYVLPKFFHS